MGFLNNLLCVLLCVVLLRSGVLGRCTKQDNNGPLIEISQGALRGRTVSTDSGFQYDSYQGIPYAKPPLGNLRFRDPVAAGEWDDILNATVPGNSCTQFDVLFQKKYYGTEDCLYLNVYVPKLHDESKDLAVMFWIHGGGFVLGDGGQMLYGPDLFVEHNVIVVTVNYRLGVFGFLSLNTPDVPGNAGMKDQVLALKWVQENIHQFGGNPEKVTIFGESAGAGSVQFQLLSPMSEGLFRGGIMQSGSSLCPWALIKDPENIAQEVARILGKEETEGAEDIIAFLRTISETDLLFASLSPNLVGKIKLAFSPTTEQHFPDIDPFITSAPLEIMNAGKFNKVPVIMGLMDNDGWVYRTTAFSVTGDDETIKNKRIPNLKKFVPDELSAAYGNATEEIEHKIKEYYFPTTDNLSNNLTCLYSDFAFARGVTSSVKLFSENSSPTYFFRFSYDGSVNLMRFISDLHYTGTAHTDEMAYMFNVALNDVNQVPLTVSDKLISKRLLQMWTNFAKHGNPTPRVTPAVPLIWPSVKPGDTDIITLDIDNELQLIPNPFAERMKFWDDLIEVFLNI